MPRQKLLKQFILAEKVLFIQPEELSKYESLNEKVTGQIIALPKQDSPYYKVQWNSTSIQVLNATVEVDDFRDKFPNEKLLRDMLVAARDSFNSEYPNHEQAASRSQNSTSSTASQSQNNSRSTASQSHERRYQLRTIPNDSAEVVDQALILADHRGVMVNSKERKRCQVCALEVNIGKLSESQLKTNIVQCNVCGATAHSCVPAIIRRIHQIQEFQNLTCFQICHTVTGQEIWNRNDNEKRQKLSINHSHRICKQLRQSYGLSGEISRPRVSVVRRGATNP